MYLQNCHDIGVIHNHFENGTENKIKPVEIGPLWGKGPDLMRLCAHPAIRRLMIKYGREMVDLYHENHLLLNPTCKNIADFGFPSKADDFPSGAAIYGKVELDADGQFCRIAKVGSTSSMSIRFRHYVDQFGPEVKIIVLVPFDSVPFDIDMQIRNKCTEFIKAVTYDEDVPAPAKKWFHLLRYRGGLELGFARRLTLGVAETGVQSWTQTSTYPSECGMFDEVVHQERIDFVTDAADIDTAFHRSVLLNRTTKRRP